MAPTGNSIFAGVLSWLFAILAGCISIVLLAIIDILVFEGLEPIKFSELLSLLVTIFVFGLLLTLGPLSIWLPLVVIFRSTIGKNRLGFTIISTTFLTLATLLMVYLLFGPGFRFSSTEVLPFDWIMLLSFSVAGVIASISYIRKLDRY